MADATLTVEAKFINNMSAGLKTVEKDTRALEVASNESFNSIRDGHKKAEEAANHHKEIFGLSMREIKKSSREGMMGVAVATEIANQGFVGAKGALEAFNIAMVAAASGGAIGGLIALGAVIATVANHFAKLKEAALAVDWYGEANKVEKVNAAFEKAVAVQEAWGKAAWLANTQLKGSAQQAEHEFSTLTGTSSAAFVAAVGGMEKAKALLADLATAAEDYAYAIEEVNKKENEKNETQAEADLKVAKTDDPVQKVKIESAAKLRQMDLDQEIKKAKMLEYSAQITQLEKSMETKKGVGGEEGKKAREEIEKKLEVVRQAYEKEDGEVESGEKVIAISKERFRAEDAKAVREEKKKQEYAEAEAQNASLASKRAFQAKLRAASIKEQNEAVKLDEERTKQIYEARDRVQDLQDQASKDPLKVLDTKYKREIAMVAGNEAAITEIKKANDLERITISKQVAQAEIQNAADVASNLMAGMDAFYAHSKKNSILHKTLAIAEIEISGAVAAAKAFELGPIIGPIMAAAIEIKTQGLAYKASQQHFAMGTLNAPGGRALVGENGPEVVDLPRGATVHNASQSQQMMGSGVTHTGDVHINLAVPAGTTADQARNMGAMVGDAYVKYLKGLKRDIKNIDNLRIPEF